MKNEWNSQWKDDTFYEADKREYMICFSHKKQRIVRSILYSRIKKQKKNKQKQKQSLNLVLKWNEWKKDSVICEIRPFLLAEWTQNTLYYYKSGIALLQMNIINI